MYFLPDFIDLRELIHLFYKRDLLSKFALVNFLLDVFADFGIINGDIEGFFRVSINNADYLEWS